MDTLGAVAAAFFALRYRRTDKAEVNTPLGAPPHVR